MAYVEMRADSKKTSLFSSQKEPCIKFNEIIENYAANMHSKEFIDLHYDGLNYKESETRHEMPSVKALKECEKIQGCSEVVVHLLAQGYNFCSP